ncbi:hypothetical protein CI109_106256 [Kwoniella shandongensis]|uniref:Uncharacterized protein n=1 Tax=Kwoniella shandongensis TaxID=1734106 RepID=A0A5M6BYF7_9TREE|nr:uncharacterized protein CI109_003859 [Kwoniella shandongensis]KAA5527887.1 hypothetical protein CI109_003859 [Kwoniella shandongensis]
MSVLPSFELTTLSPLPPEITSRILQFVKRIPDTSHILNLIRINTSFYDELTTELYDELVVDEHNALKVFYGLGWMFGGTVHDMVLTDKDKELIENFEEGVSIARFSPSVRKMRWLKQVSKITLVDEEAMKCLLDAIIHFRALDVITTADPLASIPSEPFFCIAEWLILDSKLMTTLCTENPDLFMRAIVILPLGFQHTGLCIHLPETKLDDWDHESISELTYRIQALRLSLHNAHLCDIRFELPNTNLKFFLKEDSHCSHGQAIKKHLRWLLSPRSAGYHGRPDETASIEFFNSTTGNDFDPCNVLRSTIKNQLILDDWEDKVYVYGKDEIWVCEGCERR